MPPLQLVLDEVQLFINVPVPKVHANKCICLERNLMTIKIIAIASEPR